LPDEFGIERRAHARSAKLLGYAIGYANGHKPEISDETKVRFQLDDDFLEALKDELIYAQRVASDEEGRVLVWRKESATTAPPLASVPARGQEREPLAYTPQHLAEKILQSKAALEGERKQVTVFFCDLANSTVLATRLGPETMHTLLNRFFELALNEVHRYEGTS